MIFGLTKAKANAKLHRAFATRDFTDTIAAYLKLIAKTPNDHELFNDLGVAYMESGDLSKSIQAFHDANRLLPASVHYCNLGCALLEQKDYVAARASFAKARELDATDPKPWYNITVSFRKEGRADDAHHELLNFIRSHPTHVRGMYDLGWDHIDRSETTDAIRCFTQAVDNDPEELPSRLELIKLLCDDKWYPDATPHLEALAQLGMSVRVNTENGVVSIDLNNQPFYRTKE